MSSSYAFLIKLAIYAMPSLNKTEYVICRLFSFIQKRHFYTSTIQISKNLHKLKGVIGVYRPKLGPRENDYQSQALLSGFNPLYRFQKEEIMSHKE